MGFATFDSKIVHPFTGAVEYHLLKRQLSILEERIDVERVIQSSLFRIRASNGRATSHANTATADVAAPIF
jgi:hypothetical protein